jgi:hypothetical protein
MRKSVNVTCCCLFKCIDGHPDQLFSDLFSDPATPLLPVLLATKTPWLLLLLLLLPAAWLRSRS